MGVDRVVVEVVGEVYRLAVVLVPARPRGQGALRQAAEDGINGVIITQAAGEEGAGAELDAVDAAAGAVVAAVDGLAVGEAGVEAAAADGVVAPQ